MTSIFSYCITLEVVDPVDNSIYEFEAKVRHAVENKGCLSAITTRCRLKPKTPGKCKCTFVFCHTRWHVLVKKTYLPVRVSWMSLFSFRYIGYVNLCLLEEEDKYFLWNKDLVDDFFKGDMPEWIREDALTGRDKLQYYEVSFSYVKD